MIVEFNYPYEELSISKFIKDNPDNIVWTIGNKKIVYTGSDVPLPDGNISIPTDISI